MSENKLQYKYISVSEIPQGSRTSKKGTEILEAVTKANGRAVCIVGNVPKKFAEVNKLQRKFTKGNTYLWRE